MGKLTLIAIRHAAISGRIVLARFGKDPTVALETRDAMNDFWQTLVSYAFDAKMPDPGCSADITFGGGDEQFELRLTRRALQQAEGGAQ